MNGSVSSSRSARSRLSSARLWPSGWKSRSPWTSDAGVCVMDRGRIVAAGSHDELCRTIPLYRQLAAQLMEPPVVPPRPPIVSPPGTGTTSPVIEPESNCRRSVTAAPIDAVGISQIS
jgi:hypothetical protein